MYKKLLSSERGASCLVTQCVAHDYLDRVIEQKMARCNKIRYIIPTLSPICIVKLATYPTKELENNRSLKRARRSH